ncbi:heterokaryon incompatibility protein-domain-containing protein [Nemania abortiva]|nr:heterokaryon incompatibility protein-domain-containing protein [Nemania abortiva]
MRLLTTDGLEFVEISEEYMERYAILSHTWGKEEVTFQDIESLSRRHWSRAVSKSVSAIQAKKGFVKIQKAADLAAEHGYGFIWVDTCCIDKTSSAELSEAINSMFQWYKNASICYAYMEDVKHGYHDRIGGLFHLLCQHSRWFTRGWTLQELIAPDDVMFYGEDWGYLGSKAHDEDVRLSLADITGIDVRVLEGIIQPSEISIASRMKWASQRKTTRLEDVAYCLMGLFDVNMPLLYGEGTKAFIRLQEEILKSSDDHSIFIWRAPENASTGALSGLLAESPRYFADVENYRPMPPSVSRGSSAWSMTNQGLRLSLFLLPSRGPSGDGDGRDTQDEYDAILECTIRHGDQAYQSPALKMRQLYGDQFARVDSRTIERVATPSFDPVHDIGSYEIVFVKQNPVYAIPDFEVSYYNILSSSGSPRPPFCYITGVWPEKYWDEDAAILRVARPHSNQITGLFRFFAPSISATVDFAVGLSRDRGGNWAVWYLERPSMGEPLRLTASSANSYLTATNRDFKFTKQPDWLANPWSTTENNQLIEVRIEDIEVHGRLCYFVRASLAVQELGSNENASGKGESDVNTTDHKSISSSQPSAETDTNILNPPEPADSEIRPASSPELSYLFTLFDD